jgi:hypothetical protein
VLYPRLIDGLGRDLGFPGIEGANTHAQRLTPSVEFLWAWGHMVTFDSVLVFTSYGKHLDLASLKHRKLITVTRRRAEKQVVTVTKKR